MQTNCTRRLVRVLFVVPVGVTSISVTLQGASGGNAPYSTYDENGFLISTVVGIGGKGGVINVNIPVVSGEVLQINVGG